MSGERDLTRLIATMQSVLHEDRYSFATTGDAATAFAMIREEEGPTFIAPAPDGEWARITMTVHSSLEAVGFTAAFATTLADAGISANVVAGNCHDTVFVPWHARDRAMVALGNMTEK